jgi:hypothetical protein
MQAYVLIKTHVGDIYPALGILRRTDVIAPVETQASSWASARPRAISPGEAIPACF